jgi:hypothetical protein
MCRGLEGDVADALPGAELLGPCSDEARFAAMSASADVVLAVDPSDRFERHALVAAGVGATPITGKSAGPAAAVLGASVAADPDAIARSVAAALSEPRDRLELARRVAHECAPEALPRHLAGNAAQAA